MHFDIDTRTGRDAQEAMQEQVEYAARPLDDDNLYRWADEYADSRAYDPHGWADEVGIRVVDEVVEAIIAEMGDVYTQPYATRLGGLISAACYHYHYAAAQEAIHDLLNA